LLDKLSPELRQEFLDLWGIYVSAENLQPNMDELDYEERTPMSYAPDELVNSFEFLLRLLKLVQHHVCDEVYC
jgi:hypothetical protein